MCYESFSTNHMIDTDSMNGQPEAAAKIPHEEGRLDVFSLSWSQDRKPFCVTKSAVKTRLKIFLAGGFTPPNGGRGGGRGGDALAHMTKETKVVLIWRFLTFMIHDIRYDDILAMINSYDYVIVSRAYQTTCAAHSLIRELYSFSHMTIQWIPDMVRLPSRSATRQKWLVARTLAVGSHCC